MYEDQDSYRYGTRQRGGPFVTGDKEHAMVTGQISCWLNGGNLVRDRNDRATRAKGVAAAGTDGLYEYPGPAVLDIHIDDLLFAARQDLPYGRAVPMPYDSNYFSAWNGLPKYKTAYEFRLRFRFFGTALQQFLFSNGNQGRGIDAATNGVVNYINGSNEVLLPGVPMTWEPEDNTLLFLPRTRARELFRVGAEDVVKGRFVRWVRPTNLDLTALFPSIADWSKITADQRDDLKLQLLTGNGDIVGTNAERTEPGQYGRIVLR